MRVRILCPAPRGSRSGNRLTAERWAGILRALGHRATIDSAGRPSPCDVVVALHARRSAAAVERYLRLDPCPKLIVALTGTDVYGDLKTSAAARRTVERADAIVALQRLARLALPPRLRPKVVTILQSAAAAPGARPGRARRAFRVVVLAHLRAVKDPLRPAFAVRELPTHSNIAVVHAGAALTAAMERAARREDARNPRWRWVGELSRPRARALLRTAQLLVLPSRVEGGAHVIGEAVVEGVPVLAARIPGNVGLLGAGYPGYFETGDARALRRLLLRCEREPRFLRSLRTRARRLAPKFHPSRERAAWRRLLLRNR